MTVPFQVVYNTEYPDLDSFESYLQAYLEEHHLDGHHDAGSIIASACHVYANGSKPSNEAVKIQLAMLKTHCMEVIKTLKQTENRRHFDRAVQALFDSKNPEALTFCASVTRMLRQYRLSGTYTAKEIIAEAYARSIVKIESGVFIQIPLAWLRRTCLNVIRDFKRAQTKIDKPKLDGDAYSFGGLAVEQMLLSEDLKSIRLAFEQLSLEDQNILQARIFQGLSWQEIGERLENEPIKPGTARQRGSRALIRLREHYELIREDVQILPSDDS
ncbi:MAG: sigma-70 family RNA polymerase sigma factor [Cyanobacteria bacterium P01_D01_bin.36]